jgi:hypothetical protein
MRHFTKLLFLLISISTFSQSPWTQEKGKFYTQLSYTTIPNYDMLFGDPDYFANGKISDNTIQFFGEYGLTDKTSLILNLPYKSISLDQYVICVGTPCNPIEYNKSSLGNIGLGIKHNFYKKDWLISGQLSVEANTSSFDAASGIRTGYDAWSFTPLLIAGRGFGKTYLQGFIGADIRTNDYSSNFKIGGEVGYKATKSIWLVGFVDVSKSLKNGNITLPQANIINGLYVNDQEYGVVGVKAIGEFSDNFGITASIPSAVFGNNVAKQVALSFGLYHKF